MVIVNLYMAQILGDLRQKFHHKNVMNMNHYQYLYQHYHAISFHNYQSKYFTKFSINYVFLHLVHATIFYLINISMKQAHIYYLVKIYKPTCS